MTLVPLGLSKKGVEFGWAIELGISMKYSMNEIIRQMRAAGWGYHRSTMLDDINLYNAAIYKEKAVQRIRNHVMLRPEYFAKTLNSYVNKRYVYVYHAKFVDKNTGKRHSWYSEGGFDSLFRKKDAMRKKEAIIQGIEWYDIDEFEVSEVVETYKGRKE